MFNDNSQCQVSLIESPNFLIFVQGSWAAWNTPVNVEAADAVVQNKLASVLLYDSSRDHNALAKASTDEQWIKAFDGKNYEDELSELREKIHKVKKVYNPVNIFLSGSSFGGGLVALVSGDGIPELNRVLLFSPQITSPYDAVNAPNIYKGFPSHDKFLSAIEKYRGRLAIVHGNKEEPVVVGLEQSAALFNSARTHRKSLELARAKHGFSDAVDMYVQAHLNIFGKD